VGEVCVLDYIWPDTWKEVLGEGRDAKERLQAMKNNWGASVRLSLSLRGRLNCIEHGPCGQCSRHSLRRCETWRSGQKLRTYEEIYLRIIIEVAAIRLGRKLFARTRCDSRGSARYVVVVRTRIVYLLPSTYFQSLLCLARFQCFPNPHRWRPLAVSMPFAMLAACVKDCSDCKAFAMCVFSKD
jgi:hypothetical protein